MDFRQLETLRAVAEAESFTRAATRLRVSQSAVSRQILLLEQEFDEPLFLRMGRSIRITPAGTRLLALSRRVLEDINQTTAGLREERRRLSGTIRLVGGMTVCLTMFPTLITEFQRAFPDVDVKVTPGARRRILQKLRQGTADLGFLTLPVDDDPALVAEPVRREELVFVTSALHILTRRIEIRPRDLAHLSFLMFETGSKTRLVIEDFFAREGLRPKIVTETDNVEIIKALVRKGAGVAIVPYQAVAREVQSGQLHAMRVAGHQLIRETGWVHVRSQKPPRLVEEMKRMLQRVQHKLQLVPLPPSAANEAITRRSTSR